MSDTEAVESSNHKICVRVRSVPYYNIYVHYRRTRPRMVRMACEVWGGA